MNTLATDQVTSSIAVIEQAGVPALRVAFTLAVMISLFGGISSSASDTNPLIVIQTSRTMYL